MNAPASGTSRPAGDPRSAPAMTTAEKESSADAQALTPTNRALEADLFNEELKSSGELERRRFAWAHRHDDPWEWF